MNLSKRQTDVMDLVIRGLTNPQIGKRLNMQTCTVRAHLHAIFEKSGWHDRTSAAVAYVRQTEGLR